MTDEWKSRSLYSSIRQPVVQTHEQQVDTVLLGLVTDMNYSVYYSLRIILSHFYPRTKHDPRSIIGRSSIYKYTDVITPLRYVRKEPVACEE